MIGAPDGVVVNVTKETVWTRQAALPESANSRRPSSATDLKQLFGGQIPETLTVSTPVYTMTDQRSLVEGLGILGAGIVGKVLPVRRSSRKPKRPSGSLSGIFGDALWRSDEVRRRLTAAVKDSHKIFKNRPADRPQDRHSRPRRGSARSRRITPAGRSPRGLQRPSGCSSTSQPSSSAPRRHRRAGRFGSHHSHDARRLMTMISALSPDTCTRWSAPQNLAPILHAAFAGPDAAWP